ncbi:GNAT family N-acetyltransferase [Serratia nevei]|uniref:GNAT family N-acetyltransferase n=1 Tax=Serratia nevei TaxID=2703794 RepID=UPI003FA6D52A
MSIDINQLVRLGIIPAPDNEVIIEQGSINKCDATKESYTISYGWSVPNALSCDKGWKEYRARILTHIKENCNNDEERNEILSKIQTEDYHWNWFSKSVNYHEDEYKWFFLRTDNHVEAACLIYFPKKSVFSDGNIFYVEFIAVAPWNRFTPLEEKRFKGVGKMLLQAVIKYVTRNLGYQYGFCLHSLPQAQGFYEHIGMQHVDALDKKTLFYYEIDNASAMRFVGEV